MAELDKYKQAIVDCYRNTNKNIFVSATAGCLGKNTPVLMFDGSIKMSQDIKVGDELMGADSTKRIVLKTNCGISNLYKVVPVKGEEWICNDSHIMTVHDQYITRSMKLYQSSHTTDIVDKSIAEILKYQKDDLSIGHLKLIRTGVEFKEKETKIDPYLMGLWIAEGTKHKGNPCFSINRKDEEIIHYLLNYSLPKGIECKLKYDSENCVQVTFTGNGGTNLFRDEFKRCILENGDIIIPRDYLINSTFNRLRLLAGLLDGDGYKSRNGCCFSISTKWESLGKDIVYLVRSLGLFPYYRWKKSSIKSRNFESYYFRIEISGCTHIIPNILQRKKASVRRQIKNVLHTGFSLIPLGDGEWYGFTVDQDNRYLLGDFTVTHNSGKTFTLCQLAKITPPIKSLIFLAFNKSIAEELAQRLPRTVKSSTLHSCALSSLRAAFKMDFVLSEAKNYNMAMEQIRFPGIHRKRLPGVIMKVCKLYDLMRFNLSSDLVEDNIALGERYGLDVDELIAQKAVELRNLNNRIADQYFDGGCRGKLVIDFTDMLDLAVRYIDDKDFKQYNIVMLDECLPYDIPVICENNEHIPIGRIVEEELPIKVLTFNHETGKQEFKKVTKYSKTFNTKKCIKINAIQHKKHGEASFITCTIDHKIWVKGRGYIEASEVQVGDIIQYETSAIKTQKYRVTPKGKKALSEIMNAKNSDSAYRRLIPKRKWSGIPRGGNGRINDLQLHFYNQLESTHWEVEGIVHLNSNIREKYNTPTHYKVDILNKHLKIAIEIDGESHLSKKRKDQDKRKTLCLEELGYKVIRITNQNLLHRFDEIVDALNNNNFDFCFNGKDCPVYLEVSAISEMELKEKYVYDITVEDNHNFYANGILVHNCQDISPLQYALVKKLKTPRGRLIGVGDPKQSIYSFMGSNLDSLHAIRTAPNTVELPLSMTYRCAQVIVDEANKVFPDSIEAAPGANKGAIMEGKVSDALEGDFVLCRNNAPLVDAFITLLRQGKKCSILGKEYGDELVSLIDSVDDILDFEDMLNNLEAKLARKGIKNPTRCEVYDKLEDKVNVLISLYEYFGDLETVRRKIYDIFVENNTSKGITLSTIHKSKGLEANRVFFLRPDLLPSPYAVTELEQYAEKCLRFVAITRAKENLIYVE